MTNLLLERLLRYACFTFLAVMLVLVVTACGPGGGGTGTGPLSFTSGGTSSSVPSPATPSGGVVGAGDGISACGRFDLHLEQGRVDLVAACGSFAFVGGWAADAGHQVVLPGALKLSGAADAVPATLLLQFNGTPEASPAVTATILDEGGRTLAGPGVLERAD